MNFHPSDKRKVQEQFGRNAQKYVASEGHAHGTDLTLAVEWVRPQANEVALDIATGGGHTAKAFSPFVQSVMVTDLTPKMLDTARNHLNESGVQNAQYVLADAESLPFLSESFDIVTCRIAPHHFPHPDAFIREVARVLRPNGRFLLVDNVAPDDQALSDFINLLEATRDPSHVRCLPIAEWRTLLRECGLSIAKDTVRKKTHAFGAWLDRMAPTAAHRLAVTSMLLHAPAAVKTYFDIVIENGSVSTFTTDEWIALAGNAYSSVE